MTDGAGRDRLWPHGRQSSTLRDLEAAFRASLGLSGRLKDAKSAVEASGKFSPRGAAEEHRRLAREQHLPHIVKGQIALDRARKSVQERLSKLTPKPVDKTDLVSAFRRAEIRDSIRALPREQRDSLISRHAGDIDPEVAAALLEHIELPWTAPQDRLVSPETRTTLMRRMMPADELAAIDEIEQAIQYSAETIAAGKSELQLELGINAQQFEEAVKVEAEAQKATAAPPTIWLKKDGARVVRMFMDTGRGTSGGTSTATEDEIARGQWFTPEAHAAAQAAV
jgi:hypothetical protein